MKLGGGWVSGCILDLRYHIALKLWKLLAGSQIADTGSIVKEALLPAQTEYADFGPMQLRRAGEKTKRCISSRSKTRDCKNLLNFPVRHIVPFFLDFKAWILLK